MIMTYRFPLLLHRKDSKKLGEFLDKSNIKYSRHLWRRVYRCQTYKQFKTFIPGVNYMGPRGWKKRNYISWFQTRDLSLFYISIPDSITLHRIIAFVNTEMPKVYEEVKAWPKFKKSM